MKRSNEDLFFNQPNKKQHTTEQFTRNNAQINWVPYSVNTPQATGFNALATFIHILQVKQILPDPNTSFLHKVLEGCFINRGSDNHHVISFIEQIKNSILDDFNNLLLIIRTIKHAEDAYAITRLICGNCLSIRDIVLHSNYLRTTTAYGYDYQVMEVTEANLHNNPQNFHPSEREFFADILDEHRVNMINDKYKNTKTSSRNTQKGQHFDLSESKPEENKPEHSYGTRLNKKLALKRSQDPGPIQTIDPNAEYVPDIFKNISERPSILHYTAPPQVNRPSSWSQSEMPTRNKMSFLYEYPEMPDIPEAVSSCPVTTDMPAEQPMQKPPSTPDLPSAVLNINNFFEPYEEALFQEELKRPVTEDDVNNFLNEHGLF